MQLDMKENIQNATNGAVYVKLAPGKQLGAGGALVKKVQNGTIRCSALVIELRAICFTR